LYCGAIWVAPNVLITANHCVVAAARKAETENADLVPITFRTPNDDQEYMASVIVREPSHDLALLLTETGIIHEIAPLADKISIGEPLQIVGHPAGLEYTYIVGVVAQIRDHYDDDSFIQDMMLPLEPPWLQVSADVFFGNSGGGAFNKDGQLVGISSFMMRLPATGFFIPVSEVRALMIGQHLLKARLY
jgi:serine protease Do